MRNLKAAGLKFEIKIILKKKIKTRTKTIKTNTD